MLAESIIRIGRPIMKSDLAVQEKIKLLTDVASENCKNYFKNVLIVEIVDDRAEIQIRRLGDLDSKGNLIVNQEESVAFPVFYPNGGNPLKAQGVYPLPCYLMYDKHFEQMSNPEIFSKDVLLPRIENTLELNQFSDEEKIGLSEKIAEILKNNEDELGGSEKKLGVLMIHDKRLSVFKENDDESYNIKISDSNLDEGTILSLNGEEALKKIVESKFQEAATLGSEKSGICTFSNKKADNLASIYNKSWLWLSPTWEAPCSIKWGKKEWTKGIKIDAENYEAFFYGTQFLKKIQVPVSASILKEMFAPVSNVEAKKHMKPSSFENIYGIPLVLPLLDGDSEQIIKKYKRMLNKNKKASQNDLHLELLAGMKNSIVPASSDEHRLTIIYYSGDMSRGSMHSRAVIEDVLPSVASKIQEILREVRDLELPEIQNIFGVEKIPLYRSESLPAILANAYGPGYLWDSLQKALHRDELRSDRMYRITAKKLGELANKEAYWEMKQELVFHHTFLLFLKKYQEKVLEREKGAKDLFEWRELANKYHQGILSDQDVFSAESLGFVSGLMLKQFSNSYYKKTGKDFVKHRVMKFGSKLNPEMIWKNGVLRCEELAEQWELKLGKSFRNSLPHVLLGFLDFNQKKKTMTEKDEFMTAFWSGYLIYQQSVKENIEESTQEVLKDGNK